MYIEDQYIQDQFNKNFLEKKMGNIVIYGTGIHTKLLLENTDTERIVGLMDAAKTGEIVYEKKVLSYEETAAVPDVCIVIIARNSVIHVIYRRIQEFVTDNKIPVFNINGKQMLPEFVDAAAKECFRLDRGELKRFIDSADTVSFDIFDTLLCRRVMRPTDVFQSMDIRLKNKDYKFSSERMRAESELAEGSNYNIYDIYRQFQKNTGVSDAERKELLELEVETEKKFLMRREDVCKLLEYAFESGKKVYLISDMYIPKNFMEDILKSLGVVSYSKLYVSTDYKSSKAEKLFEIVRDESKAESSKWLHIGDNFFSDVYAPERLGIKTYKLYSTTEMLEESIYSNLLENNHSLEENIVLAYFASTAFNSPFQGFHENGKLRIACSETLAELIIAPVLAKYMSWLVKSVKKNENDFVIFPSRDGYVLKQLYDSIKERHPKWKLPDSVYLYTSRRAALVAAAKSKEDVRFIAELPDSCGIPERICKRFEVEISDEKDGECISEKTWDKLLECCEKERNVYYSYLKKVGLFEYKNPAFVDFVAVGTIQEALQRMAKINMNGLYFLRRSPDSAYSEKINCESMYPAAGDFQNQFNIYKYYYFLENVLSSYEPTFKRISLKGESEFFEEPRTESAIAQLKEFHAGILSYCREFFALYPDIEEMNQGIELYDALLGLFNCDTMDIDADILNEIVNYDEFLGKKVTELNR